MRLMGTFIMNAIVNGHVTMFNYQRVTISMVPRLLIKSGLIDHLDLGVVIYGHGCDQMRSSLHVKR